MSDVRVQTVVPEKGRIIVSRLLPGTDLHAGGREGHVDRPGQFVAGRDHLDTHRGNLGLTVILAHGAGEQIEVKIAIHRAGDAGRWCA